MLKNVGSYGFKRCVHRRNVCVQVNYKLFCDLKYDGKK